jgi:anti-anti-sigma factor
MEITQEQFGNYLVIKANGRLDASWAEYFTDTVLDLIRNGHHQLIIDAMEISFLSSAGIRSLLSINKELQSVKGSFLIVHAPPFVEKTIEMTGFKKWLSDKLPDQIMSLDSLQPDVVGGKEEVYILNPAAKLSFSVIADWQPWQFVEPDKVQRMRFPTSVFALGIGGAADQPDKARDRFGDFLAAGGHVIFQPPEAKARPDFLLAEREFVPELLVIQALCCQGEMSHLIRFAPGEQTAFLEISRVAEQVLDTTKSKAAAFVMLAEVEGLVGATLIQSPGLKSASEGIPYPEIRDWLSFCGEKVYSGQQALIFGIVAETGDPGKNTWLWPFQSKPGISGHFHATVFPYQPLQNGKIDLIHNIQKFLNGPPPQALLHLVDDNRPAVGLGQSSFIRGACWCSAIQNGQEELL